MRSWGVKTIQRAVALRDLEAVPSAVRQAARAAVKRALASGALVRPAECSECGAEESRVWIIAHHVAGYGRADWLNIAWLCDKCHKRAHIALNKAAQLDETIRQKFGIKWGFVTVRHRIARVEADTLMGR